MLKHIPFYASLLNRDLGATKAKHSHVLVYGAVEAHSLGEKGCIASNQLLANETGLEVGTVKNVLTQMSKARWLQINYTDSLKNERITIQPLLEIKTPSLSSDTPVTPQLHPRHSVVTIEDIREDSKTSEPRSQVSENLKSSDEEVVFDFDIDEDGNTLKKKKMDTSYRKVFALFWSNYPQSWNRNTTQIRAARALMKERGMDQVKKAIQYWHVHCEEPYCPDLSTPYDLDTKWDKLLKFKNK